MIRSGVGKLKDMLMKNEKNGTLDERSAFERELQEEKEKDTLTEDRATMADVRKEAEEAADKKAEEGSFRGTSFMPKPTFSTFVLSLASSALVQLGEVADPSTGKKQVDLVLAKHSIDILSMLQEKTAKSLDAEETRLLEGLLYELRMKFVMRK